MALSWRKARLDDAALLWRWANDAETRRNAFDPAPIPYADHVGWLERRLASAATRLLVFSDEAGPVGQVRFDVDDGVAEIDIAIAPERRGHGLGTVMLREALGCLRAEWGEGLRPRAHVLAHNERSLRMFRRCGFREVGTQERHGARALVLEPAAAAKDSGDRG
ncbi:MAG: GNAT family N-acetyltransferase [Candidatus Rokuibacteriota bacterium]|nr:MAG: GNAT family N-acetyltransferase [Candidatus Rokubacteria bacterium]